MVTFTDDGRHLARFKELILQTCGFSLELGREQALIQALRNRMAACGVDGPLAYHGLLIRDRDELNRLVELLTVNETYFFREPDYLRLAVEQLVPELLSGGGSVRLLSAGCSTGEEPYSLAIMLRERYGVESERRFAVAGVDIDASAIAAARRGVYGKGSFRGIDPGLMERYFDPAGPWEYRIRERIGKLVDFGVANLLDPAYPQSMQHPDIIFYRNVSIYFPQEVQRRIFVALAGLLKPGGYLMVGATETFHHDIGVLSLVERDGLFFYRKAPVFEERRRSGPARPLPEERRGAGSRTALPSRAVVAGRVFSPGGASGPRQPAPAVPLPADLNRREGDRAKEGGQGTAAFDSALEAARGGQSVRALALLEEVGAEDPSFARACALKGSLFIAAARYDEAAAVCQGLLARDPLCLEACLMLGIVARHQGDNAGAFRRFREAAYLDPACWLAHFYTAEILFQQGETKRARSGYETVARLLEKGGSGAHGEAIFQLSFNAEQFQVICRHKLSLLKENG